MYVWRGRFACSSDPLAVRGNLLRKQTRPQRSSRRKGTLQFASKIEPSVKEVNRHLALEARPSNHGGRTRRTRTMLSSEQGDSESNPSHFLTRSGTGRNTPPNTGELDGTAPECSKSQSTSTTKAELDHRWRVDAVCFLLHLCHKTSVHFQVKFLSLQIYNEQLLPYLEQSSSTTVASLRMQSPILLSTACCLVASKLLEGTNHRHIQELWRVVADDACQQDIQGHHQEDIKQVELYLMEVLVHSDIGTCIKLTSDHIFEIFGICQASMIVCEKFLHLSTCFRLLESLHIGGFQSTQLLSSGGAKLAAAIILVTMVLTIPETWKSPVPLLSFLSAVTDQGKEEIRGKAVDILQHVGKHGKLLLSPRK